MGVNNQLRRLYSACQARSLEFASQLAETFHQEIMARLTHLQEYPEEDLPQWQVIEAARLISRQQSDISGLFTGLVVEGFETFLDGVYTGDNDCRPIPNPTLSLVADEELDKKIACNRVSTAVLEKVGEEILPLCERFRLLAGNDLPEEANPVGPVQLAHCFRYAIEDILLEKQVRLVFFEVFESVLQSGAGEFYQSVNSFLIGEGVLPKLTYQDVQKKRLEQKQQRQARKKASTQLKSETEVDPSRTRRQELIDAIRGLQQDVNDIRMIGEDSSPATINGKSKQSTNELAASLFQLQSSLLSQFASSGNEVGGSSNSFDDLMQGLQDPAACLAMCQIPAADQILSSVAEHRGVDSVTIDAGSMQTIEFVRQVFTEITCDDMLPQSARNLLSYLFLPFLRSSLKNAEMFSIPDYPPMQLLDKLAGAGSQWVDDEGNGLYGVYGEMKQTVAGLLQEPAEDMAIYQDLLQQFSIYMSRIERRVQQLEKLAAQKLAAENNLVLTRARVHNFLVEKLDNHNSPLPVLVVSFLMHPWFEYLTSTHLRFGEKSEQAEQGLQLVENLLWSLQPKCTEHEINRLNNLKKLLNKQIESGLDSIGYDPVETSRYMEGIDELQRLSSQDFSTSKVVGSGEAEEAGQMIKELGNERQALLQPQLDTLDPPEREIVEKLIELEPGTWFERMGQNSQPEKMKLSFIDKESHRCLFVNESGKQVAVMDVVDLARQVLANTMQMTLDSSSPFVDRILETIYQRLAQTVQA
jgi:hypothetical protein